jgi:hypothetical protein
MLPLQSACLPMQATKEAMNEYEYFVGKTTEQKFAAFPRNIGLFLGPSP